MSRRKDSNSANRYNSKLYNESLKRRKGTVPLTATDIYYGLKDAIVTVYTETQIRGEGDDCSEVVRSQGSGFFVSKRHIVTAAHVVLFDNHCDNRYPPRMSCPLLSRVGQITVRVNNVNCSGEAYFYEATLVGVSGSLDIAVLEISDTDSVPKLKSHPVLNWGCSRKYAIGEPAYVLADTLNAEAISISSGIVMDNLAADARFDAEYPFATWGFEAVITDASSNPGNAGGPLLDSNGRVIGVISGVEATQKYNIYQSPQSCLTLQSFRTVAVSEYVAHFITSAFLAGPVDESLGHHLELVNDPLGNYYRYATGSLGITGYEAFGPKYIQMVPDSKYNKQKGFVITSVDHCGPLAQLFTNIYSQTPIEGQSEAVVSKCNEIYLLTSVDSHGVGVGNSQVPISSTLLKHVPRQCIQIKYRRGSDNYGKSYVATVQLGEVSCEEDLPPQRTATIL